MTAQEIENRTYSYALDPGKENLTSLSIQPDAPKTWSMG